MDFDDTPDEAAWRTRVRNYLSEHRDELGRRGARNGRDDVPMAKRSQACLFDGGFVGVTWAKQFGGQGGTPMQQAIVDQEMGKAGVPSLINMIGIGMCGPTVIAYGSDEQKQRYLRPLLRGEDIWCQLFSEPASGSDLAALRTKAVRGEDGSWRITGQKVWTTGAQISDYGIILTRTNPDVAKHKGLTMFLVDMHASGVTVRPLRQMSGGADFNEVFFDDVVIPDSERLGDIDNGWRVALTTLMSERLSLGGGGTDIGMGIDAIVAHAAKQLPGLSPERQALARQDLGRAYVASLGIRYTGYRQLSAISRGEAPGPEASAGKLAGTVASRAMADLGVRLLGEQGVYAQSTDGEGTWQHLQAVLPGMAIAGGTDQVLRNVLGERVLGLPTEPRSDKNAPVRPAPAGGQQ